MQLLRVVFIANREVGSRQPRIAVHRCQNAHLGIIKACPLDRGPMSRNENSCSVSMSL